MNRYILNNLDEAFDLMDDLFASISSGQAFVPKLPNYICSNQFPPSNISVSEDGNLLVEVAVAGYDEDEIKVSFEDHHLIVTLEPKEKETKLKWVQRGIKNSKAVVKFLVHERYDDNAIQVTLKNGILSLVMKVKEEAKPKTIEIKKG